MANKHYIYQKIQFVCDACKRDDRPHYAQGKCQTCYRRLRRHNILKKKDKTIFAEETSQQE